MDAVNLFEAMSGRLEASGHAIAMLVLDREEDDRRLRRPAGQMRVECRARLSRTGGCWTPRTMVRRVATWFASVFF
jgi:hypothetical protein